MFRTSATATTTSILVSEGKRTALMHSDSKRDSYSDRAVKDAARELWPKGKDDTLTSEEFVKIVSELNHVSQFGQNFGSKYQNGIFSGAIHKLFWLFIPQENGRMPKESFIRAIAALYRPDDPKRKIESFREPSFKTLEGRPLYYNCTRAYSLILFLYSALYDQDLPYHGDIINAELHSAEAINKDFKKWKFILRLSDSERDPGIFGINFFLTRELPDNSKENIRLLFTEDTLYPTFCLPLGEPQSDLQSLKQFDFSPEHMLAMKLNPLMSRREGVVEQIESLELMLEALKNEVKAIDKEAEKIRKQGHHHIIKQTPSLLQDEKEKQKEVHVKQRSASLTKIITERKGHPAFSDANNVNKTPPSPPSRKRCIIM